MNKALRTLYLWNLSIDKSIDQKGNGLDTFFEIIANELIKNKYYILRKKGYRDLFYGVSIVDKVINGKVIRIRDNSWPEVFNEKKGTVTKLDLSNEDELIETTHFVLKQENENKWNLLLEFNQLGARAENFLELINFVGVKSMDLFVQLNLTPEFDDINKLIESLKKIASFQVKIRTDNVDNIQSRGLTGSLKAAKNAIASEYINIGWELSKENDATVKRMINSILGKGLRVEGISELSVRSHTLNNSRLEKYNLLKGKVKFTVRPDTKSKRVLDSTHMFSLMTNKFKHL